MCVTAIAPCLLSYPQYPGRVSVLQGIRLANDLRGLHLAYSPSTFELPDLAYFGLVIYKYVSQVPV